MPTGVRIPLDARPCQRHGTMTMRLSAFRILYSWLGEAGVTNGEVEAPPLVFALLQPASRFT